MAVDVVCVTVGCFVVAPTDVAPVLSFDTALLLDGTEVVVAGDKEEKDEAALAVGFVFVFVLFVVTSTVKAAVEACVALEAFASNVVLALPVVLVVGVTVVVVVVVVILIMVVFAATFGGGVTVAALEPWVMAVVISVDIGFDARVAVLVRVVFVIMSLVVEVVVADGAVRHKPHFTGHVLDTLAAPAAPGNTNASLHSRPATSSPAHSAGSRVPAHTGAHAERRS